MSYQVKTLYYTLQGEGARAGRPAVFCRFAGCNLWNGRDQDRAKAKCWFCDTDFVGTDGIGGGSFPDANALASAIASQWPKDERGRPYVVFTGGEPLLQLDEALLTAVKAAGFETSVETNGTLPAPAGLDWITVSPKPGAPVVLRRGNELKLVYPQEVHPDSVVDLEFDHFYLSPLHSAEPTTREQHLKAALDYCLTHPRWQLTMQYHKIWNIP
ncbi:MAG: 7-carboxy-7-deazaguanine synthase [Bdellovibrionales bacterium]|nr:7-carboxy-7-deazaguanine synthase [Bdellovibrionales bacterium]